MSIGSRNPFAPIGNHHILIDDGRERNSRLSEYRSLKSKTTLR